MAGSRAGGLKAWETTKARYSEEERAAWAKQGGSAKVEKGFAKRRALAKRVGEKGGKARGRRAGAPDVAAA